MEEIKIYPKIDINEDCIAEILTDTGNINMCLVSKNSVKVPTNLYITSNVIFVNNGNFIINNNNEKINVKYDTNTRQKKDNEININNFHNVNNKIISEEAFFLYYNQQNNLQYNYYHFWADFISKLFVYNKQKLCCNIYYNFQLNKWQREILELMDFNFNKLILTDGNIHFTGKVYICTDGVGFETSIERLPEFGFKCMQELRDNLIFNSKILLKESNKFLYLSRQKSSNRKIINEEEFIIKCGFKTIYLEEFSVLDQIQTIVNATVIIAPHGAGNINIVFSKNLKLFIELHDSNYIYYDSCFFQMCNTLNINYKCIDIKPHNSKNNAHFSNFYFSNWNSLENLIKNL